jgi:DNA topoisomerase II
LQRSIPSIVDGLKPGQRKILFACFKRKLKLEIKVAQLAGYVAEHSAYHHGEQSLAMAIINMAQTFVGSNNISLLVPSGQFGTRLQGGADAASPRYIFTYLNPITRMLFDESDDAILKYVPLILIHVISHFAPPLLGISDHLWAGTLMMMVRALNQYGMYRSFRLSL